MTNTEQTNKKYSNNNNNKKKLSEERVYLVHNTTLQSIIMGKSRKKL